MQPRMFSPQADQFLMQAIDRPAERCEIRRRCRKGGTDGVVAADTIFLDAAKRLLVTVIDRGRAAASYENDERMRDMPLVGELACDAGDIVVADEGLRHEGVEERIVALQRPGQL